MSRQGTHYNLLPYSTWTECGASEGEPSTRNLNEVGCVECCEIMVQRRSGEVKRAEELRDLWQAQLEEAEGRVERGETD